MGRPFHNLMKAPPIRRFNQKSNCHDRDRDVDDGKKFLLETWESPPILFNLEKKNWKTFIF